MMDHEKGSFVTDDDSSINEAPTNLKRGKTTNTSQITNKSIKSKQQRMFSAALGAAVRASRGCLVAR